MYISDYEDILNIYPIPVQHIHTNQTKELPNPSVVRFNDFQIAFTNSNLLNDFMEGSIISNYKINDDEILSLFLQEILNARNYHPITPFNKSYDITLFEQFSYTIKPNVVILNSNGIPEFIQKIDDVIFINLHKFVKRLSFGSVGLLLQSFENPESSQQFILSTMNNEN